MSEYNDGGLAERGGGGLANPGGPNTAGGGGGQANRSGMGLGVNAGSGWANNPYNRGTVSQKSAGGATGLGASIAAAQARARAAAQARTRAAAAAAGVPYDPYGGYPTTGQFETANWPQWAGGSWQNANTANGPVLGDVGAGAGGTINSGVYGGHYGGARRFGGPVSAEPPEQGRDRFGGNRRSDPDRFAKRIFAKGRPVPRTENRNGMRNPELNPGTRGGQGGQGGSGEYSPGGQNFGGSGRWG